MKYEYTRENKNEWAVKFFSGHNKQNRGMFVCELCVLNVPPLDNNQQIVWQCSEFSFAKKLFYVLPVGCQVATVAKSEFLLKCITQIVS